MHRQLVRTLHLYCRTYFIHLAPEVRPKQPGFALKGRSVLVHGYNVCGLGFFRLLKHSHETQVDCSNGVSNLQQLHEGDITEHNNRSRYFFPAILFFSSVEYYFQQSQTMDPISDRLGEPLRQT